MSKNRVIHRVRLRGPWTVRWLDAAGQPLGNEVRIRHPDDWLPTVGNRGGRIVLTRSFHAPSNLDAHETLSLVLTGIRGTGEVWLNETRLGRFDALAADAEYPCPLPLPFFNHLVIDVAFPQPTTDEPHVGVFGVVELAIHSVA